MKLLAFERWVKRAAIVIGCALSGACAAEDPNQGGLDAERRGNLAVALKTTAESGATYYLEDATILVTTEDGAPVAALSSEEDPEAELISVELNAGRYVVSLQNGWSLTRRFEGNDVSVPATLTSPATLLVNVFAEREGVVNFAFRTEEEEVSFARGSLGVTISIEESGTCGNGVTEAGEVCDGGADAGLPNGCDANCRFECVGACPLRVDPSATESGTGASWSSPMRSVQAAIDVQSVLGGGEVWVRGPGPFEALSGQPFETLIELREGIAVIGGFAGTEQTLGGRDPAARTQIAGASADASTAPLVVVASNSVLEGFEVLTQNGPTLSIQNAENFRISNLIILGSQIQPEADAYAATIEVVDSQGVFDGLLLVDGFGTRGGVIGIHAEGSDLRVSESALTQLVAAEELAGIVVFSSRLVVEDTRFVANHSGNSTNCHGICAEDSDVLVVGSTWFGNGSIAPGLEAGNSRVVVVNSHWERNSSDFGSAFVHSGSSASFLNCSFVENRSYYWSTIYNSGAELEVVNTTFFRNTCEIEASCPEDISPGSATQVSVSNSFSDAGPRSIWDSYSGGGNCLISGAVPHDQDELGYRQVFLTSDFGCTDIGVDAAALDSAERAREFAADLGVELPLETGAWWQGLSSVYPLCDDSGPIDPGRHFAASWCDES